MTTLIEKQTELALAFSAIYESSEARNIAQWVVEDVTKWTRPRLTLDRFKVLTPHQVDIINEYKRRLLTHEPIQYVLGYTEFYGSKFKVNSSVLIPRPETEELVSWIIDDIKDDKESPTLLDIGTGSGCIPVSLKKELPNVNIHALDISAEALMIAEENAMMNKVEVHFYQLDILKEIPSQKYNILVSNPPYISFDEKDLMSDNVLRYEPHLALFSELPLLFYQRIADIATRIVTTDGTIYVEMSEYRAAEIATIFALKGFKTEIKRDISGKERILKAF